MMMIIMMIIDSLIIDICVLEKLPIKSVFGKEFNGLFLYFHKELCLISITKISRSLGF